MKWIEQCDEKVSLAKMLGFSAGDSSYWGSMKIHCPFSYMHADGGIDKNFRLYLDTNTAWCFEESLYLTPSRLYARQHDITQLEAAKRLCDLHGIKPPTTKVLMDEIDRWDAGEAVGTSRPMILDAARLRANYRQSDMTPESVISAMMQLPEGMSYAQCLRAVEILGDRLMNQKASV